MHRYLSVTQDVFVLSHNSKSFWPITNRARGGEGLLQLPHAHPKNAITRG